MNKFHHLFLFFVFLLSCSYTKPDWVSQEIWNECEPYFLPESNPIKCKLDLIFTKDRVTKDLTSLKKHHFKCKKGPKADNIVVAKHAKIKGFLVKLYTDEQCHLPDWDMWIRRIKGAQCIREIIHTHGYRKHFRVPKKWIYPLPCFPEGCRTKNFVLIVEDMRIGNYDQNAAKWKSHQLVTKEKLQALFIILSKGGLIDSVYIDNIPFSDDCRIAFIDTEHFGKHHVNFHRLRHHLPVCHQEYWDQLIRGH